MDGWTDIKTHTRANAHTQVHAGVRVHIHTYTCRIGLCSTDPRQINKR